MTYCIQYCFECDGIREHDDGTCVSCGTISARREFEYQQKKNYIRKNIKKTNMNANVKLNAREKKVLAFLRRIYENIYNLRTSDFTKFAEEEGVSKQVLSHIFKCGKIVSHKLVSGVTVYEWLPKEPDMKTRKRPNIYMVRALFDDIKNKCRNAALEREIERDQVAEYGHPEYTMPKELKYDRFMRHVYDATNGKWAYARNMSIGDVLREIGLSINTMSRLVKFGIVKKRGVNNTTEYVWNDEFALTPELVKEMAKETRGGARKITRRNHDAQHAKNTARSKNKWHDYENYALAICYVSKIKYSTMSQIIGRSPGAIAGRINYMLKTKMLCEREKGMFAIVVNEKSVLIRDTKKERAIEYAKMIMRTKPDFNDIFNDDFYAYDEKKQATKKQCARWNDTHTFYVVMLRENGYDYDVIAGRLGKTAKSVYDRYKYIKNSGILRRLENCTVYVTQTKKELVVPKYDTGSSKALNVADFILEHGIENLSNNFLLENAPLLYRIQANENGQMPRIKYYMDVISKFNCNEIAALVVLMLSNFSFAMAAKLLSHSENEISDCVFAMDYLKLLKINSDSRTISYADNRMHLTVKNMDQRTAESYARLILFSGIDSFPVHTIDEIMVSFNNAETRTPSFLRRVINSIKKIIINKQ